MQQLQFAGEIFAILQISVYSSVVRILLRMENKKKREFVSIQPIHYQRNLAK